jgi:hypothetical protein
MNLGDFNTNFAVTIVHFDDTTTNASVNFKVQCLTNSRVSLHTAIVDTTALTPGYTEADVISAAWNSIKAVVNAWASFNITEPILSDLTITTTSSAISLSTFNNNFTVRVVHFNIVPNIDPTNWSIQLNIRKNTDESTSTIFEGLVPLTTDYCNNTLCSNIALAAWEVVKDQACDWALANLPVDPFQEQVFVPVDI